MAPKQKDKLKAAPSVVDQGLFTHVFTADNPGKLDDYYEMDKKTLGEGSYGVVSKGKHKATGRINAIKAIACDKVNDQKRFEQEIAIQKSLDHPHIVKVFEVFKDEKRYYLVMELCTGGELFDRIIEEVEKHEGQAFEEKDASRFMTQIMGAMNYCHQRRYVHRDIKPENFLLQSKGPLSSAEIKVIDFGLAKQFKPGKNDLYTKAGTPYYVAPQVLLSTKTKGYNHKCDIWSCGVLLYILICGYPPFFGDNDSEILKMVKKGKFEFPDEDWEKVSKDAKDMISKMLTFDPDSRPSAQDLLSHPWLDNSKKEISQVGIVKDLGGRLKKWRSTGKFKKIACTYIAQQLKQDDIRELKDTFRKMDKDHSGTLSIDELKEGLLSVKGSKMTAELDKALNSLDTDGSGQVDYSEFVAAAVAQQHLQTDEVLWMAFRYFDVDNSGFIEASEMKQICEDPDIKAHETLFKDVDVDGDGRVSWDEFKAMMKA